MRTKQQGYIAATLACFSRMAASTGASSASRSCSKESEGEEGPSQRQRKVTPRAAGVRHGTFIHRPWPVITTQSACRP